MQGRLVFGDNRLVRRFLRTSGSSGQLSLVLVNSPVRGGAGGNRDNPTSDEVPPAPSGTVGTFRGARYDPRNRYRSMRDCLMGHTNQHFCVVCQRVIRSQLGA